MFLLSSADFFSKINFSKKLLEYFQCRMVLDPVQNLQNPEHCKFKFLKRVVVYPLKYKMFQV